MKLGINSLEFYSFYIEYILVGLIFLQWSYFMNYRKFICIFGVCLLEIIILCFVFLGMIKKMLLDFEKYF